MKKLGWVALIFIAACRDGKDGGLLGPGEGLGSHAQPLRPSISLQGAAGLLIVDPSGAMSAPAGPTREETEPAQETPEPNADGAKSLQKTDSQGNLSSAITSSGDGTAVLPKILTIAVSPKKELYLHFEQPFRHKEADASAPQNGNPWSDGTHCQIFRVKGGTVDELAASPPSADNLECLTYHHMINNWQGSRNSVFQFDSDGNVYFPGQIPNSPKTVVYRYSRDNGELREMINANICVQDFLVTPSGGIFYTGMSSCNGGGNAGGGYFRYVSGDGGGLVEIARDWWSFIFEPISTQTGDKALFFGPDPRTASTASWSSACLFRFDPNGGGTTAERTEPAITCGGDIWSWISMSRQEDISAFGPGFMNNHEPSAAYKEELAARCTSAGQVFAGGGSQIAAIKQDSQGHVFVIGKVRKKNAGTLTCSVELRGPHCKLQEGPDLSFTDAASCTNVGGTWIDEGDCWNKPEATTAADCLAGEPGVWSRKTAWYNDARTSICRAEGAVSAAHWWSSDQSESFQTASTLGENVGKFRLNGLNCMPPPSLGGGDGWTTEYQGLAEVDSASKSLRLLSSVDEQAIRLWLINDTVYYSAFNTVDGRYTLRTYDGEATKTMVDGFEVYNLSDSGEPLHLLYDGLEFSNNSYSFGTIAVDAPYQRAQKAGLTGTVKTIVMLR